MIDSQIYLNVPYAEKELAKKLGAKWDREAKSWFIPIGIQPESFDRWLRPIVVQPLMTQELTIELVPKTCWYTNVRSQVTPQVWDFFRKKTYQQANYKCEICGGRGDKHPVECHEVWHYNDNCQQQTLIRLIALCPACHECKHIGFATIQGRGKIAAKHLAKVNQWSDEQALAYIEQSFDIWERRSQFKWKLDISYLELKN